MHSVIGYVFRTMHLCFYLHLEITKNWNRHFWNFKIEGWSFSKQIFVALVSHLYSLKIRVT